MEADLAFAVYATPLNTKLQGRGLFAHELHSPMKAFIRRLQFLSR